MIVALSHNASARFYYDVINEDPLVSGTLTMVPRAGAVMMVESRNVSPICHGPVSGYNRLLRHIPGKLLIVWDDLPGHRSRKTWEFLQQQRGRLWLE